MWFFPSTNNSTTRIQTQFMDILNAAIINIYSTILGSKTYSGWLCISHCRLPNMLLEILIYQPSITAGQQWPEMFIYADQYRDSKNQRTVGDMAGIWPILLANQFTDGKTEWTTCVKQCWRYRKMYVSPDLKYNTVDQSIWTDSKH